MDILFHRGVTGNIFSPRGVVWTRWLVWSPGIILGFQTGSYTWGLKPLGWLGSFQNLPGKAQLGGPFKIGAPLGERGFRRGSIKNGERETLLFLPGGKNGGKFPRRGEKPPRGDNTRETSSREERQNAGIIWGGNADLAT